MTSIELFRLDQLGHMVNRVGRHGYRWIDQFLVRKKFIVGDPSIDRRRHDLWSIPPLLLRFLTYAWMMSLSQLSFVSSHEENAELRTKCEPAWVSGF